MLNIENLRVLLVSLNFKAFHWFEDINDSFFEYSDKIRFEN